MAITFNSVTINNVTREYLTIRIVPGDLEVIFKDQLEELDIEELEKIDATAGTDLYDKMQNYTMPNNQDGYTYFSEFYRRLIDYAGDCSLDFEQRIRGAVGDTLTVPVDPEKPHVFVTFQYFDSVDYDNEVTPTAGTITVSGRPHGSSGYFEIFNSPIDATDTSAYAEQGSSLNSVKAVPTGIATATHYQMTVVAFRTDGG